MLSHGPGKTHTTLQSDEPAFVVELRRKLPRYHWRPLAGIRVGEALADLQRVSVKHAIRLPTSFALVGKTLAQADSIPARSIRRWTPSSCSAPARSS